ncbi:MAG: HAD family phosphatase [Ruminococcaceae bacterium]|nr:HAD family phosphatase [Oscillospiraceae bacterium]
MNFKYAVFDLDGTLLDTQKYWDKYEREILGKRFGIDMFNDENGNYIPFTGLKAMFDRAMKLTGKTISLDEVIDELYDLMREVYRNGNIETMPRALDFLKALKAQGIKTAIATATNIDVCKPALERMGLLPYLDELVCTDYVGKNKNHPDVFDRAMELIGGNKEETMVFEDSLYAANTLKKNGFRYTIIEEEGSLCCIDELKDGCENYIKSYEELL